MIKINVLGTTYNIIKNGTEEKYPYLKECNGYCDTTIKQIVIQEFKETPTSVRDLKKYSDRTLRHEIIHAFLYESGLWYNSSSTDGWAVNEEMVDWLAIQSPKIFKIFKELKIDK